MNFVFKTMLPPSECQRVNTTISTPLLPYYTVKYCIYVVAFLAILPGHSLKFETGAWGVGAGYTAIALACLTYSWFITCTIVTMSLALERDDYFGFLCALRAMNLSDFWNAKVNLSTLALRSADP